MDKDDGYQPWTQPGPAAPVAGAALLRKAFGLVDLIAAAPGHVTPRELQALSGWPRPTLYRILGALAQHGFVRLDPTTQGYTLGYRPIELAQNVWSGSDLAAVASPELRRLRDMTGETAYLAVLQDGAMIALGKFEGPHADRSSARLGVRKPLHCTSQGKAALAFLPRAAREKLLARMRLDAYTPNTIVRKDVLRAQFATIRARGYAIEDEEILTGVRCVGAPILDAAGAPLGAVSVAAPTYRLTLERANALGPEVATVARHIRMQLRSGPAARDGWREVRLSSGQSAAARYAATPVWDARRGALMWIDAAAPRVFEQRDGVVRDFALDAALRPHALVLTPQDEAFILTESAPARFVNGQIARDGVPSALEGASAATSGGGHLWTAHLENGSGVIRRADGAATRTIAAVNADVRTLAWSEREACLYAADPKRGAIYMIDPRGETRVHSRVSPASGEPRALAVDPDGRLWIALYDGWSLARLSADGEIDAVLAMPAPRPTGLAFGGADGRTLFVTTARAGVSDETLRHSPASGLLFDLRVG